MSLSTSLYKDLYKEPESFNSLGQDLKARCRILTEHQKSDSLVALWLQDGLDMVAQENRRKTEEKEETNTFGGEVLVLPKVACCCSFPRCCLFRCCWFPPIVVLFFVPLPERTETQGVFWLLPSEPSAEKHA